MVMLSPSGTSRLVLRHRIVELQLPLLGQLQDHRRRHRLGDRRDAEVGVGVGPALLPQLRRAGGGRELALGRAQQHQNPGTSKSSTVWSTSACSAAGSIGFSPDVGAVVVEPGRRRRSRRRRRVVRSPCCTPRRPAPARPRPRRAPYADQRHGQGGVGSSSSRPILAQWWVASSAPFDGAQVVTGAVRARG